MSGEIVVGACYRDWRDGEIVRVLDASEPSAIKCVIVRPADDRMTCINEAGRETWRQWPRDRWERVPDPTPAVTDNAESPLAGEMTLRQVEAWRVRRGIDDLSLMYATRTGLWHAHAERDGTVIGHGTSSDPQDAITALMAWVGP